MAESTAAAQTTPAKSGSNKTLLYVLGGLGALVVLCVCCLVSVLVILPAMGVAMLGDVANDIEDAANETQEEREESRENAVDQGEMVEVGDFEFKVLSAENIGTTVEPLQASIYTDTLEAEGEFIVVEFEAKNTGGEDESIFSPVLIGSDDSEYSAHIQQYAYIENTPSFFNPIEANTAETYQVLYDVPAGTDDLIIKFRDGTFGLNTGYSKIDL